MASLCQPYEIVEVGGLAGLVLEHIEGQTLADKMTCVDYQIAMRILAKLQFQLHNVPIDKLELNDIISVKEYLAKQINRVPYLSNMEKNSVMNKLKNLPNTKCLCHGDLHMLNVIMQGENPVVIDWQGASIGHPAYDVMQLLVILRYAIIPSGMLPQEFIDSFYLTRDEMEISFIDEYLKLSGMKMDEIEAWLAPCAASRLNAGISDLERKNLLIAIRNTID